MVHILYKRQRKLLVFSQKHMLAIKVAIITRLCYLVSEILFNPKYSIS